MQNGFIDSFNGKLRDEFPNEILFTSLHQGRAMLSQSRNGYNTQGPTQGSDG